MFIYQKLQQKILLCWQFGLVYLEISCKSSAKSYFLGKITKKKKKKKRKEKKKFRMLSRDKFSNFSVKKKLCFSTCILLRRFNISLVIPHEILVMGHMLTANSLISFSIHA